MSHMSPLTARELEVVRLVADGHDNNRIATHLHISPHTVKGHLRSARAKLGLPSIASRTLIAVTALREGLIA